MNSKTLAAQLYTVREFLKTPEDIERSLRKVKKIGYNAVEVSGLGPIEPARLKELVDEIGLNICATHNPFIRFKDDTEALIAEHKLWGCKYIGLGSMPQDYRTSIDGYHAFIRDISKPAKKIADEGLQFVYHNHKFEFQNYDGVTGMDILLNGTSPATFGFELDTYWVQSGGANPIDWIKKFKGRMKIVHFKDMAIKDDQQVFAEIGQGNLNWPEIIKTCRKTHVEYFSIEQDKCFRDPFESLSMSYNYLKQFFIE